MESLQQPKSLVDQAYEVILNALCDGTLRPDERLTQEEIAARLNVSRQPVTHALAVLKAQGFVTPSGRRGLVVTPIKPAFFEAIYQLRSAVEPLAVSLAIPRLDKAAIVAGREIISRGRSMVANNDAAGGLQADIDFHAFIYELSGNSLIADSMRLHWHHLRRAMSQVLAYPGMSAAVWQEHENILDAMAAGDAENASRLVRSHLMDAFQRVSLGSSKPPQA
jgi:DNA-binding GntR family transcriptional regulator